MRTKPNPAGTRALLAILEQVKTRPVRTSFVVAKTLTKRLGGVMPECGRVERLGTTLEILDDHGVYVVRTRACGQMLPDDGAQCDFPEGHETSDDAMGRLHGFRGGSQ